VRECAFGMDGGGGWGFDALVTVAARGRGGRASDLRCDGEGSPARVRPAAATSSYMPTAPDAGCGNCVMPGGGPMGVGTGAQAVAPWRAEPRSVGISGIFGCVFLGDRLPRRDRRRA
jgi:hypothetical protein